ncbi:hypothetical protein LQ327_00825 [Actinomycetospora endophytica]|uniref:Uncharacterized protein n=1 Tax=Actinomycetospora endophytica TaxID=2291215 RepID=A0ABS8P1S2_9PSEU|nr:hypothetical protein [Actinomycetospora endophytica]MCD2191932.1 hypothetical protein [Actinomycetospora endophytica]
MTTGQPIRIDGDFVSKVLVTALPVPVRVEVPQGWERPAVLPSGVSFAVGHPSPDRGVRATITIDGDRWAPSEALEDIASRSVEHLAGAGCEDILVLDREHLGTASMPALTQRIALRSASSGVLRDLVQDQVYLGFIDQTEPSVRAVVRLVLTAASEQHDQVTSSFQAVVNSVVPDPAAEADSTEKR